MSVEFEENNPRPVFVDAEKPSRLAAFVLSTGVVKTERQANLVLLGVAVFALVLMFFFFSRSGSGVHNAKIPQEVINRALQVTIDQNQ